MLTMMACGSGATHSRAEVSVLPDTTPPLSAGRHNNTTNEYAMVVARYGKPDSILSTENDSPKPKISTRIAHYQTAYVKVAFAANGCVAAYEKAMEILADIVKYPALGEDEMKKMKSCVPTAGWTIVGYMNSSDNTAITAQLATIRLNNPQKAADTKVEDAAEKAAKKAKTDAELKKVNEDYLKALERPVDPKVIEENRQRNREQSGGSLSEAEKLKKGCEVAHLLYDDKRISDLSIKELKLLRLCGALSY